ncbi:AFL045Cp [Eremothecium gossypii ATCC 10895]|uniref:AFL045Cp n=1 Tax=Eremothecium gossypii (strain ATCC 10895 / CBS 109.51 / FGSC 9923 / NRRL Y-1056) TaxID=284811 RepID=Q754W2_EREGS|nr:AFL045Cp [Eremothecium gossypii ATCC 10895]AAS53327.1 AFL045Cp [Eremothecium gossypii ATCC 10895]AEY97638.1 FAFL045Cp [Eremothecium gossypii FDAG1]
MESVKMQKRGSSPMSSPRKKRKHLVSTLNKHYKSINKLDDYRQLYISDSRMDIFVWGTGSMCELGLGPLAKNKEVKRPRLNPLLQREKAGIVSFAVGGMHCLALDSDNNVWSWGTNDSGALGRDTSGAAEQLRDMDAAESSDDEDGDLNELEATPTMLPRDSLPLDTQKVVQLAATDNLSCVLFENGDVYAWGTFRCNEGILGFYQDAIESQRSPWKLPSFSGSRIVQMAPGKDHILFLDEHGVVYAWGNGQQYQLGRKIMERSRLRTLDPRAFGLDGVKYIASGENHSFALADDGRLFAWGLNQFGQCGISNEVEDGAMVTVPTEVLLPPDVKVESIAAGEHHSIVLTQDGDLYTFGRLDMFEVGISAEDYPESTYKDVHGKARSVPVPTKLKGLPKFKAIAAGSHHSLAVARNGIIYSWGFGETYAVGLGPAGEDVEVPTRIKNTATQHESIVFVGCGGQFSVAGGIELSDEEAEKRAKEMGDE